ncbi:MULTISPECIES: hypothetical protein [unclassified Dysgonomonas]|uniref:hypothetical protein n=1 Tax=unclassified Dysgonomonas TaxID=2630389 RepID=UPI000680BACD|nr:MULTISPECIES: hypothetical protein [unclassified Dysgonomonas]MBD8346985.1 hypothetical protein [Dysgonomonas sp. HGC4]MBF0575082.1 hypothetical protein [Dysgonomonas sp. GY617]
MTNRQKIASLFIIVFFGVILMKPVHFFFVDHGSHYDTHCHSAGKSAAIHQDCDICLFMLQAFTPQQFAELQQHFDIYFAEIIQAEIQTQTYQPILHVSLRAPPALGLF